MLLCGHLRANHFLYQTYVNKKIKAPSLSKTSSRRLVKSILKRVSGLSYIQPRCHDLIGHLIFNYQYEPFGVYMYLI